MGPLQPRYERLVAFGPTIKKGKSALRWPRLSCHAFWPDAVRLQLFAVA